MKELTNLGKDISSSNSDIKYDRIIKNILAYKPILSRIFKETVVECKDMSYDEIEECIEGEIEIEEGKHKTVKFLKLTDEGFALDVDAPAPEKE